MGFACIDPGCALNEQQGAAVFGPEVCVDLKHLWQMLLAHKLLFNAYCL